MNALDRFSACGVRFRLDGGKVIATLSLPITDAIRTAMTESKEDIRAELEAIESRRQRVLALLAEKPGQQYALIYDTDVSAEYDVLAMAISEAAFEVRVPKPADSLEFARKLMQMIDKHYRRSDLQSEGEHRF